MAKAVLIIISSLTAIICTEALLRTHMPVIIQTIASDSFQPSINQEIVYELKPLSCDHNRDGIRDHYYPHEKPKDVYRIAVIGDSLAYGACISLDCTYSKVLEKKLNELPSDKIKYEIINFGVPGYKTTQIVERFKEKVLQYNPDFVIYGYWLDDITDNFDQNIAKFFQARNNNSSLFLPENSHGHRINKILLKSQIFRRIILLCRKFESDYERNKSAQYDKDKLSNHLDPYVFTLYSRFLEKYNTGGYNDLGIGDGYYGLYVNNKDFMRWNDSLIKLSNICKAKKIQLLMLMTPVLYDRHGKEYNWRYLHEFIKKIAVHYAIPMLDLQNEFSKYDWREISIGDCEHPNKLGNNIIAERLFNYILAKQETILTSIKRRY